LASAHPDRPGRAIRWRGAIAFALALLLIAATAASAEAKAVFSVQPVKKSRIGYFVLAGRPGATLHGDVRVLNVGDRTGSASLYAVDGTTGQTSGAVYRSRQEKRRDVGAWLRLSETSVTLAPGAMKSIPFTVRVPSNAYEGQHLGGIVAQASARSSKTVRKTKRSSFQVKIQELSVVAVQVNLPGPRVTRMAINSLRPSAIPGHQDLQVGLSNAGNVLLKGSGSLTVVDGSGKRLRHQDFPLDTFVPHTHINLPIYTAGKALPVGSYKGTVVITYWGHRLVRTFLFKITAADNKQAFGSPATSTVASPTDNTLLYALIGGGVLLLAAIAFGLYRYLWAEGYI
jgi:Bacterial protein of unknown function (DUF916)